MPHARRVAAPACPAFAEAASRRQAKGHFGVQARTMKIQRVTDTKRETRTRYFLTNVVQVHPISNTGAGVI